MLKEDFPDWNYHNWVLLIENNNIAHLAFKKTYQQVGWKIVERFVKKQETTAVVAYSCMLDFCHIYFIFLYLTLSNIFNIN